MMQVSNHDNIIWSVKFQGTNLLAKQERASDRFWSNLGYVENPASSITNCRHLQKGWELRVMEKYAMLVTHLTKSRSPWDTPERLISGQLTRSQRKIVMDLRKILLRRNFPPLRQAF